MANDILICDCTLQNGGKVCEWNFGKKAIKDIISKMKSSGVDMMEVGMLGMGGNNIDSAIYNELSILSKFISDEEDSCIDYSVTTLVENELVAENLCDCPRQDLILRVQFAKRNIEVAEKLCHIAKRKGYRISIHPLHTIQYSIEEYIEIIEKFKRYKPEIIYIDDGIGAISCKAELCNWLGVVDKYALPNMKIGFCGYFINEELINIFNWIEETAICKSIVLDGSIGGIGYGAGMLPTEYLLSKKTKYNLLIVERIYFKYISKYKSMYQWGKSLFYKVATKCLVIPEYIDYLSGTFQVSQEDLIEMLNSIPIEERFQFKKQLAKKIFYSYMKKKSNLAIIIPTANRPSTIEYWLAVAAREFYRLGVDIIIYDSSNDRKTEAIVWDYYIEGCENLIYKHYEGEYDGFSIDTKVIDAYKEYGSRYKYIWMCRDGLLIYPSMAMEKVQPAIKEEVDFIICNATFRDYKDIGEKKYTKPEVLFQEQCAQMTVLGAIIVKSTIINKIIEEIPLQEGKNYSLWQPIAFFDYIAYRKFAAWSIVGEIWSYNPFTPPSQSWKADTLRQWCELWYKNIMSLPAVYDLYKKEVLKIEMYDFHPFDFSRLLEVRAVNGLKIHDINRNKEIILQVSDTSLTKFYIVAFMPRGLARLMATDTSRLKRGIRLIYRIMKGMLLEEEY